MIPPPDRTMFKGASAGRDSSGQQLSSMEKLIRFAEKDDWLLYVTALFGILMPGIMYFIYKKAHNAYLKYAQTRSIQKRQEKKQKTMKPKKLQLTIFYCGQGTKCKKLAYEAAEKLEDVDPLVVKLAETDFGGFQFYSGICLFLISVGDDHQPPPECTALFDYLREAKFEKRQKALLDDVAFSVFAFVPSKDDVEDALNIVNEFKKQMSDLGGRQLCDNVFCHEQQVSEHFDVWMTETRYTAKRCGVNQVKQRKLRAPPESSESDTELSFISSDDDTDHEKFD